MRPPHPLSIQWDQYLGFRARFGSSPPVPAFRQHTASRHVRPGGRLGERGFRAADLVCLRGQLPPVRVDPPGPRMVGGGEPENPNRRDATVPIAFVRVFYSAGF